MKETTAAVDTTAILLREGDLLRVRAAVGLGREVEHNLIVKVGDGFAGTVAASAQEQTFDEHPHAQIVSPILRSAGLQTLYGVPLIEDGDVIGVAHMGSKSAHVFSIQDKRLFAAMVARATSAIRQQMLHEAAVRASKEAQEREAELRTLADNMPQLAWMADPTGARFWFNRRWHDYSGASLDEIRGWGWQTFHHPAHAEDVMAKYRHAFETGQPWEDTYPLRGKDGHYQWFLSRAVPIRDSTGQIMRWFGTSTDVTNSRMMNEVMTTLASTLDYDEMIAKIAKIAVPDFADWCAVDLVEPHGLVRRVAIAHSDPAKAEAARRFKDEYPYRSNDPIAFTGEVIRSGDAIFAANSEDEIEQVAADARHAELLRELGFSSFISAPLLVRGRTLGAISFVTSSAARRFQEADIAVANELARRTAICIDNARLYREAQDASRLRETVLAIVSHELRTPVSTIDLAATMLLHAGSEPRLRKPAETIRRACERMDKMIGDLLDMAAIQSGRLRIEPEDVLAADLLNETVELHEPLAAEKQIKILRDFDMAGVHLYCDRDRIQQVFSNLIGNAKKFCQAGDVIVVRAHVTDKHATFAVVDTGPGIAADEIPHIFEPYWSGDRGKKTGAGLGLFIASAIVKAHGGELSVTSKPGDGATFSFTMPIARRGPST
ncbi:MAG TPA: ATP-binding protein [Kofleriaceae bacterium]